MRAGGVQSFDFDRGVHALTDLTVDVMTLPGAVGFGEGVGRFWSAEYLRCHCRSISQSRFCERRRVAAMHVVLLRHQQKKPSRFREGFDRKRRQSADDFVAGEELRDFDGSGFRRVRAMDRVFAN